MTQTIVLLIAFVLSNLPWLSDNLFFVIKTEHKNMAWYLLEILVMYFIVGAIALYAEYSTSGQLAPQQWEFYAITVCLFFVFTFPGFIYKVLYKKS